MTDPNIHHLSILLIVSGFLLLFFSLFFGENSMSVFSCPCKSAHLFPILKYTPQTRGFSKVLASGCFYGSDVVVVLSRAAWNFDMFPRDTLSQVERIIFFSDITSTCSCGSPARIVRGST